MRKPFSRWVPRLRQQFCINIFTYRTHKQVKYFRKCMAKEKLIEKSVQKVVRKVWHEDIMPNNHLCPVVPI